jgi:hypothetical protein
VILSRNGYGAGRSESIPLAALFLSERDLLAEALNRLDAPGAAEAPRSVADH